MCLLSSFGKTQPIFPETFSTPSLWDVDNTISVVLSLSHRPPPLCSFLLSWLAPVFRLNDWSCSMSSSPVRSCHIYSVISLIWWDFYFCNFISSYLISIQFFFMSSVSFKWLSVVYFFWDQLLISKALFLWPCFKILQDKSHMWFISVLSSVGWFF